MKLNFHNVWHNHLKKELGASFVGFETYRDKISLKVTVNKKTRYVDLKVGLDRLDPTVYNNILNDLKNEL